MRIDHPRLIDALRKTYSAEKAASLAYVGHARSLKDPEEKSAVKQIELDEWEHRRNVLEIMKKYEISISRYYEWKYYFIGKIIGFSCYVIGRFMPYFFAGKLESGNVCEYFVMMRHFHSLGINEHDELLYEMGIKEKEHEIHFLEVVKDERWLPIFEKIFCWGTHSSLNDLNLDENPTLDKSYQVCNKSPRNRPREKA